MSPSFGAGDAAAALQDVFRLGRERRQVPGRFHRARGDLRREQEYQDDNARAQAGKMRYRFMEGVSIFLGKGASPRMVVGHTGRTGFNVCDKNWPAGYVYCTRSETRLLPLEKCGCLSNHCKNGKTW